MPRARGGPALAVVPGALAFAAVASIVHREPPQAAFHVPTDDAQILAAVAPVSGEALAARAALQDGPEPLPSALRSARRYIELARQEADPRFLGYARAALAPWAAAASPPVEVLVLRATVRQHDHDFAGALADLERALADAPGHPQALVTKAVIHQVRGDHARARAACEALPASLRLARATCVAGVDAVTGSAQEAVVALERALAQSSDEAPAVVAWARTVLAEATARSGADEAADARFREAIAGAPRDPYLLGAYADFLLDQRRFDEVVTVLAAAPASDGLLLRRAIAEAAIGAPQAAEHTAELRARFAELRRRGDDVHAREAARFALELEGDPAEALRLARRTFAVQREPADARLLLEAAVAAGQPDAARPALEWLEVSGIEGARLRELAEVLRGAAAEGAR